MSIKLCASLQHWRDVYSKNYSNECAKISCMTLYEIPFKATNSGTGESLMPEGEYLYPFHSALSAATLQNSPIIIVK